MKTGFLTIIIISLFIGGCNSISQPRPITSKSVTSEADTLYSQRHLTVQQYTFYHNLVKKHFESQLLKRGFNGGILVAKNGEVVYEKYQGYRDLRIKDSLTANTSMHIASTSKTFTGMAILKLIQDGKLALEDTLGKFFPAFPYPGVTVKTLLNHRSGLPNYVHYLENMNWDTRVKVTNQDVLNSLYTLNPPREAMPDRRFSYSNTNYVLLALIIEKITGESYPSYMKQTIFEPLALEHTWVATPSDSARITPSFDGWGRYWQTDFLDLTYGDKNIYSTPRDLLKWDIAVSNGQIVNRQLLEEAYTAYSNEKPSRHNYGLGWRLLDMPGNNKVIYHNGRWHGSNAAFARLDKEKATIIIIGNRYNSNIYAAAKKAYNVFGKYTYTSPDSDNDDDNLTRKTAKKQESLSNVSSSELTNAGKK